LFRGGSSTNINRHNLIFQRNLNGSAVTTNSILGGISFGGYDGTTHTSVWAGGGGGGVEILAQATQNWSSGNNGSKLTFYTTPNNSDDPWVALTLGQDQSATFEGDVTIQPGMDLTVDTNVLYVDATNNRVGVNNAGPTVALDVTGGIKLTNNLDIASVANPAFGSISVIDTVSGTANSNTFRYMYEDLGGVTWPIGGTSYGYTVVYAVTFSTADGETGNSITRGDILWFNDPFEYYGTTLLTIPLGPVGTTARTIYKWYVGSTTVSNNWPEAHKYGNLWRKVVNDNTTVTVLDDYNNQFDFVGSNELFPVYNELGTKIISNGTDLVHISQNNFDCFLAPQIKVAVPHHVAMDVWNNHDGVFAKGISISAGKNSPASNGDIKWLVLGDGNGDLVSFLQYSTVSPYAAFVAPSDSRLKTNIQPSSLDATNIIRNLGLYSFDWKNSKRPGQKISYIAQQAKEVYPEMISEDENGFLYAGDSCLIPVLVKSLKEAWEQIDLLKSEIELLKNR
jgi:hypothetical protein